MFVPKKGSKRCSCVAITASLFILEIITSAHTANHSIQIAQQNQFHILGQMEKNDIKKTEKKKVGWLFHRNSVYCISDLFRTLKHAINCGKNPISRIPE